MSIRLADRAFALLLAAFAAAPACVRAQGYPSNFDFGAPASAQEIAAIAIAIAPDGAGLPGGSGDYARGKQVYETKERVLGFETAHLYLQVSTHSNYPPREVFFDKIRLPGE